MSDTPYVYPPMHNAVEVAARLRKEIAECVERKIEIEARRARVGDNFETRIEKALTVTEQARIRDDWKCRNEELRIEIARCEASHSEFRRLLQWLTGELWS